jgi:hypothetical protein
MGTATKDRLCLEEFQLSEAAIETIAAMIGTTITAVVAEQDRESPNEQKIRELKDTLRAMGKERQEIYKGNDEMKRSVITRYTPVLRERFAHAEHGI